MQMPPYIRGLIEVFSSGKRAAIALISVGAIIVTASLLTTFFSHINNEYYSGEEVTANTWTYVGAFLILLAILVVIGDFTALSAQKDRQEAARRARVRSAEEKLENAVKDGAAGSQAGEGTEKVPDQALGDVLDLSVLWEVTNARLDDYHGIATGQAKSSFRTAQAAITGGFILLLGFAVLSFRTHSTTSSITIAVLGGVAAGLSGYIGRTFIRSQETAARYLRAYFDQPLAFSRYLAAERLLSSQSDVKAQERDALLRIIISAMVESSVSNTEKDPSEMENLIDGMRELLKIPDA
jgi:hypothetical protein